MRRWFKIGCLLAVWLIGSPVSAATISFSSAAVNPGDEFLVDIRVDGLDAEIDILGFFLNFTYDINVLTVTTITEGNFLSRDGLSQSPNVTDFKTDPISQFPGITITNFIQTGSEKATGSGLLATLRFSASTVGLGNLSLLSYDFVNSQFDLVDPPLVPDVGSIVVSAPTPTPVPEPSTLALLAVGLAGMARQRLKRRTTA